MVYSRNTLIRSTIWKLFERFSSQVVSFIVSIILSRILMPEEYGVIAILLIFIYLANVIIDGGLNTALIQKKNTDNIDFSTILYVSLILATILYLILFFLSPIIANFYENSRLVLLLRVLSINLFFNSFNAVQRAYVSKNMMFSKLFYSSFGAVILSGVCGIILAYKGCGAWSLVGQQLVSQIVTCLIMWYTIKWRPIAVFSFERFKGLFNYGWKIFVTNFVIAIYENIRGLIIGKMYSPISLAYFERGKSLPSLFMDNINVSIRTVLFPALSSEQDNKLRIKQMMRRSMNLNCYITFPLLIGLFVVADSFVAVLLTEKWMSAVPFIRIFCIALMLLPLQNSNIEAIKALGYSGIILKLELIKKILEAVILVISFTINVYAVAWGIVVYNVICIFINLYPNRKLLNCNIFEQFIDILPIFITSVLMGGVTWSVYWYGLSDLSTLIIQVCIGFTSYILFSKLFKIDSFIYLLDIFKEFRRNKI